MSHTFLFVLGGLATIVLTTTAAFTFLRTEPGTSRTWEGVSGFFSSADPSTLPAPTDTERQGEGRETLSFIPLPSGEGANGFATDLVDLLSKLTQPPTEEDVYPAPSAYAFIPQGLVTVETPRPLTPQQEALREYGNSVGLALSAFADLHPNMPQILKDQAEDRTDPLKSSELRKLAGDFSALGNELAALQDVPTAAANAHSALAAAYRDVGDKLGKIPDAQSDETFLVAINSYNPAAEALTKRLVALADLFGTQNVAFSTSDPGSIFTFSAGSSF